MILLHSEICPQKKKCYLRKDAHLLNPLQCSRASYEAVKYLKKTHTHNALKYWVARNSLPSHKKKGQWQKERTLENIKERTKLLTWADVETVWPRLFRPRIRPTGDKYRTTISRQG